MVFSSRQVAEKEMLPRKLYDKRSVLITPFRETNLKQCLKAPMNDPADRLPPLNALRAFEAAARRLSFTKAAEELNVTPGAISQHIRQLEDYAGTPLFKRTGRSVLLTDAAQAALPMVRDAFDQIAEAGRIMQQPARKGRVMVSSAPSFAAKWLAPRLDRFHTLHQDVEAWVSADSGLTDFTTADADFAIRYGAGNYDGLKIEKLLDETVLPVCSPKLLEGADAIRKPSDLSKHTLIHDVSAEVDPSCPDWNSWLKARGAGADVDGDRGPRFNQSALAIEAAASGRGVVLAKRAIAASDIAS
ncbi:MAG: transcriptional regulator GcvA, partial [Pseudomonadota bacterium]